MRRWFLPLAVLILLAAAGLRLGQLGSYPPGPHYDEAANLLITRSIALDGAFLFPIVDSYQGRESLYYYLAAPLLRFVADDMFALRLTSVFTNLMTLAAAMALGRMMFRGERGLVIGLVAGMLLALSFHQIFMSRQAYRAVSLPLMQALALLFLWRGLRMDSRRWLLLAGVFAGGALYTYMASRLFPVWLALGGLALLLLDAANWQRRLRQGAIFFGALALAALPLALYALDRPDVFTQRLTEVADGDEAVTLLESARRHAGMFFIRGDFSTLRYNMPGRPYFTPLEGVLLLVGLAVALWRLARREPPLERAAYFLALLSPLMVIPAVISVGGVPPSHMRSLGMVPLIFVLVAAGFEALYALFLRALPALWERRAAVFTALVAGVLLLGGGMAYRLYMDWARQPELFYQTDADLALAMRWLPAQVDDDTLVYVAAYHREHPTVIAGWDGPVTWLGADSLFLPPPGYAGLAIFAHDTPPPADWLPLLEPGQLDGIPAGPDGAPAFHAYRLSHDLALAGIEPPAGPIRSGLMSMLGALKIPIPAGEGGEITLVWRIEQSPPYYRLRPILELRDEIDTLLAASDAYLLGTDNWRAGEIMLQRLRVDVPPGTPPGEYPLYATWVDRDSETFIAYVGSDGAHAGIQAQVASLEVIRPGVFPAPDTLEIAIRQPVDLAPGVRLLGWNPPASSARPGEALRPVLFWQGAPLAAGESERAALSLRAILRADDRDDTVIWAGEPVYPPARWDDGELVTEPVRWMIPHEQPPGTYTLLLEGDGDVSLPLGTVEIAGLARLLEPPPVAVVDPLVLGDVLLLHGYEVEVDDGLRLELVWSARGTVAEDYTVFVHLVDDAGRLVDQRDAMPRDNTYPTSLWIAGEYVPDPYRFETPAPGEYWLRVGFYRQADGVRLAVTTITGDLMGDYVEIGPIIIE
jgi:hypothetical protein